MTDQLILKIRRELKNNADLETQKSGQNFFKEAIKLYGVKSAEVSKIAKTTFPKNKTKNEIFKLCEELLNSDYLEESLISFDWSERLLSQYQPADFSIFASWLEKYVNNWAKCDTLCNHTVGSFIEKYPKYINHLILWAHSDNRWVKRGAAVSLIIPAKKGLFKEEIFKIADILLLDQDDMVQKGYGWMLKVFSQSDVQNQKIVFDYVFRNRQKMPRAALRYAIEKMPQDLRQKAMEK